MLNNEIILIKPTRHKDERGFFSEIYSQRRYRELGVDVEFPQENHSFSWEVGTLRGLHFQAPPDAQGKLVRCGKGAIFDVAVDIRVNSPTFGKWVGEIISDKDHESIYIPEGFAHGFCVLSDYADVLYKVNNEYSPEHQSGIMWNDPKIKISWPIKKPIISIKDSKLLTLENMDNNFIYEN